MYSNFRCLTQGNLVDTFLAIDDSSSRQVLAKRPAQYASISRDDVNVLLRESYRRFRALRHPNILAPLQLIEDEECLSIVFPFIQKEDLIELNAENFLKLYKILLPQMFGVIDFVHSMGIVHCDINSSNWLIVRNGSAAKVLLTDFDLATEVGARPDNRLFGTPEHIAPEILRNEVVVPQSDFYSLGFMLRKFLTTASPGQNHSVRGVFEAGLTANPLTKDSARNGFEMFLPMVNELTQLHYHDRPLNLGHLMNGHATTLGLSATHSENQLAWDLVRAKYKAHTGLRSSTGNQFRDFLFQDVRIVGIPAEVIEDLTDSADMTFRQKVKWFKNWITTSRIDRYGEFLFVQLSESEIKKFYQAIGLIPDRGRDSNQSDTGKKSRLRQALRLKARHKYYKCILLLLNMVEASSPAEHDDSQRLWKMIFAKIAEAYQRIGKPQEAASYYQSALDGCGLSIRKRCSILIRLADLYLLEHKGQSYWGILNEAYRVAKSEDLVHHKAQILTKQLWLRYTGGKQSNALSSLVKVEAFAAREGMYTRRIIAANAIGCIYMSQGHLRKARVVFVNGIRKCKQDVSLSALQALYINLGLVCNDLGLYRSATRHLSSALKNLDILHDMARQSWAYNNLSATFSLQGRQREAIELIMMDFTIQSRRADPAGLARAYLNLGWANLRSGECREASLNLERACSISRSLSSSWLLGRSLLYLSILGYWQGDHLRATRLLKEAQTLIDPDGDRIHALDATLLSLQLDSQKDAARFDLQRYISILEEYLSCSYITGAAASLLYVLANKPEFASEIVSRYEVLKMHIQKSESELANALRHHVEAYACGTESSTAPNSDKLKIAFSHYRHAGMSFAAAITAEQIAQFYEAADNAKLAAKFLQEAIFLADSLANHTMEASLREYLSRLSAAPSENVATSRILTHVAGILNSLSDTRSISRQLLNYAISLTGAERGALFLADSRSGQLRIETSCDCDGQSIEDISDISQRVIKSVYQDVQPLIVDNAVCDDTTRLYKSIISLNILSILCIPLLVQGELKGVLYLDHRCIPALFSTQDGEIIKAIADFIAVALMQSRITETQHNQNAANLALLRDHGLGDPFVTCDPVCLEILARIPLIAGSGASVLIHGESGTGKEILAKMIHNGSARCEEPFVCINCATLEGALLESELFGIEKGVATGVSFRKGRFHAADRGTFFLDEVGDMPIATQAKLLRTLEQHQFEMVGSNTTQSIDVRVVAATNRDLNQLIKAGKFRSDLLYRINTIEIVVPPLRERVNDTEVLLKHFAQIFAGPRKLSFTSRAMNALKRYTWPGNVRELRNLVERLSILCKSNLIDTADLPPEIPCSSNIESAIPLRAITAETEKQVISRLYEECDGNVSAVARELNIPLTTLRRRMTRYGITKRPRGRHSSS